MKDDTSSKRKYAVLQIENGVEFTGYVNPERSTMGICLDLIHDICRKDQVQVGFREQSKLGCDKLWVDGKLVSDRLSISICGHSRASRIVGENPGTGTPERRLARLEFAGGTFLSGSVNENGSIEDICRELINGIGYEHKFQVAAEENPYHGDTKLYLGGELITEYLSLTITTPEYAMSDLRVRLEKQVKALNEEYDRKEEQMARDTKYEDHYQRVLNRLETRRAELNWVLSLLAQSGEKEAKEVTIRDRNAPADSRSVIEAEARMPDTLKPVSIPVMKKRLIEAEKHLRCSLLAVQNSIGEIQEMEDAEAEYDRQLDEILK